MVKKFMKGLLGKKGEKSAGKDEKGTEEVPDELPALAEDTLKKEEEKPAEAREEATEEEKPTSKEEKSTGEVTDELPPLEEEKKEEKPKEEKEEVKEEEEDDLLKEFREYKEEFKEKEDVGEKKVEEKVKEETSGGIGEKAVEKEIKKPSTEEAKTTPKGGKGFFSEVLSITKEQGINESILKQDLTKKMKDYWYLHPHEKKTSKNKEKLQQDLFDELRELKQLEEKWITQKRFIEEGKGIILEKERDIKTKTEELQRILNQLEFYKDVAPDEYFWLNNGVTVKNLHELMNLIEVIDDKTFHHHVHNKKNDFGHWIKSVVGNEELAKKISDVKTREEMLVILENASIGNIYGINPENYFKLNNGRVIKDVKELIPALKEVNEGVFKSHVNNKRNDFSSWIRDTFKNDYLADKLQTVKSKEGMIKILKDFFKI